VSRQGLHPDSPSRASERLSYRPSILIALVTLCFQGEPPFARSDFLLVSPLARSHHPLPSVCHSRHSIFCYRSLSSILVTPHPVHYVTHQNKELNDGSQNLLTLAAFPCRNTKATECDTETEKGTETSRRRGASSRSSAPASRALLLPKRRISAQVCFGAVAVSSFVRYQVHLFNRPFSRGRGGGGAVERQGDRVYGPRSDPHLVLEFIFFGILEAAVPCLFRLLSPRRGRRGRGGRGVCGPGRAGAVETYRFATRGR